VISGLDRAVQSIGLNSSSTQRRFAFEPYQQGDFMMGAIYFQPSCVLNELKNALARGHCPVQANCEKC
jgi:hypothetical protein